MNYNILNGFSLSEVWNSIVLSDKKSSKLCSLYEFEYEIENYDIDIEFYYNFKEPALDRSISS